MKYGAKIEGSNVVPLFGGGRLADRCSEADNDNGTRKSVCTVTVRKRLPESGVMVKIKVPVTEFYGVSVSTAISEEGVLSSAIELVHHDETLTYKVFEETGNANVVAEWQNWGRKLRLPLYIRAGDGTLMPYSQRVSGVIVGDDTNRRRLGTDASRRPRFLNRRKVGETESA
ncbi:MAG: hypothetical protein KKH72_03905 [Alphaproteobacteria bacterium]|nr:hypothetical protein [Alphaproteobacteria bacterium]